MSRTIQAIAVGAPGNGRSYLVLRRLRPATERPFARRLNAVLLAIGTARIEDLLEFLITERTAQLPAPLAARRRAILQDKLQ
jgi:hypothetical protein